jgi:hypothetical protein
MKSFQAERQFSYKKLLYQCAIFLAAVAVIVYFLPKEGTFNYQFDINKPWKYGLLQASFDFPIYKGDEEVRREQDSIMTNYHPTSFCRKIQVKKQSASLKVITTGAYAR